MVLSLGSAAPRIERNGACEIRRAPDGRSTRDVIEALERVWEWNFDSVATQLVR